MGLELPVRVCPDCRVVFKTDPKHPAAKCSYCQDRDYGYQQSSFRDSVTTDIRWQREMEEANDAEPEQDN